jgi:hypothetical protein
MWTGNPDRRSGCMLWDKEAGSLIGGCYASNGSEESHQGGVMAFQTHTIHRRNSTIALGVIAVLVPVAISMLLPFFP